MRGLFAQFSTQTKINKSPVGTRGFTCGCATEVDVLVEIVIDNPYREDNIIASTHQDHADLMVTAPQSLKPNKHIKYAISVDLVNGDDYKSFLCYVIQMAKGIACREGFDSASEEYWV